jgi:ABC-type glycerol-3-phosphate transport system substrate-binding protein
MRFGTDKLASRRRFLESAALGMGLLAATPLLQACAQGAAPAPTQAPAKAPEPTKAPAAEATQVAPAQTPKVATSREPLVVWMSDDWSGQADKSAQYKKMAQDASAEIGIPVDYRPVDWTTLSQQTPILMAADKYTVDILDLGDWDVFNWARQGKLLPLDNLLAPDFVKQAQPPLLEHGKYNGKLYAFIVWPSWVIGFYNKDLYQKAGLDPEKGPTTLAEMEEQVKKLQAVSKLAYLDVWTEGHWTRVFTQLVTAKDGHWFEGGTKENPDNVTWTFTSPQCKEAVTWMKHMLQDKMLAQESLNLSQQDVADRFALGDAGITFNWDGFAAILEKPESSKIIGKIGSFAFPGDQPQKGVGAPGFELMAVPKSAKNPEGAGKFIQAIESAKIQKTRALTQYYNPAFTDLYKDAEIQKKLFYSKAIEEIIPRTLPTNFHPKANEVNDYLKGKLQGAAMGQVDVDSMLADVQKFAQEKTKV